MRAGSGSVVAVVHPAVVRGMLVGVLQLFVESPQCWVIGRCGQCFLHIIRSECSDLIVASLCWGHGSQYTRSWNSSGFVRSGLL